MVDIRYQISTSLWLLFFQLLEIIPIGIHVVILMCLMACNSAPLSHLKVLILLILPLGSFEYSLYHCINVNTIPDSMLGLFSLGLVFLQLFPVVSVLLLYQYYKVRNLAILPLP